jgi:tetratricopeptide (TPR) repeat protein
MDEFGAIPDATSYRYSFHFFLIAFIIAIIYSNSLVQEWHFDDYPNIIEDTSIHWRNLSWNSIFETITTDSDGQKRISRPLPRLTFALNYYISKFSTLSYHITNILIHFITAFFVYLVFRKTLILLKAKGKTSFSAITCEDVALLGAVLWAIHPLQTQSVVYIVQRMASMAAMFYIMSMYFYIHGRLANRKFKKITFFLASFFCGLLAFFSKENAVLLPLSIVLYELMFFEITKKQIFSIISLILLFAIAVVCVLIITRENNSGAVHDIYSVFKERIVAPYNFRPFTMSERILTEPRILLWYLFLIICPISDFLSLESDITVSTGIFQPISTFVSIFAVLMLIIISLIYYKKIRIISFALLFFFINHFIESSFIGLELYFEHRNYLPSIFLYLGISSLLIQLYKYYQNNNRVVMHYLIGFFIVSILVSEGNATYLRNDVWHTEETLHNDNLLKAPNNIRPRVSLSSYYLKNEKYEEALNQLYLAEEIVNSGTVRIQKNWIGLLYHNLGSTYYRISEFDKSKTYLLKSLEYDQYSWETHAVLGIILFMDGHIEQSVKAYTNAVNLHRSDPKLFNMYGRALFAYGNYKIALEIFREGLELAQNSQQHNLVKTIKFNMISCYLALDDLGEAKKTLFEIENYFDNIAYSAKVNFQKEFKSLKEIAVYNDIGYLIYKTVLYPLNNDDALEKIADYLVSNNENYCEFIKKMVLNNSVEIIFPPLTNNFEKKLTEINNNKLNTLIEKIYDEITDS